MDRKQNPQQNQVLKSAYLWVPAGYRVLGPAANLLSV